MRRNSFLAVLLLLVCGPGIRAQFETSAVLGFVRDSSGAPIANGKVTLVNVSTGITTATATDSDGHSSFPTSTWAATRSRPRHPGSAILTQMPSLSTSTRASASILTLKPGSVSETVIVSGAATQLEAETSSTGTEISETQVHDLPLNGRA